MYMRAAKGRNERLGKMEKSKEVISGRRLGVNRGEILVRWRFEGIWLWECEEELNNERISNEYRT